MRRSIPPSSSKTQVRRAEVHPRKTRSHDHDSARSTTRCAAPTSSSDVYIHPCCPACHALPAQRDGLHAHSRTVQKPEWHAHSLCPHTSHTLVVHPAAASATRRREQARDPRPRSGPRLRAPETPRPSARGATSRQHLLSCPCPQQKEKRRGTPASLSTGS